MCGREGPALSLWLECPARGCVPWGWWEAVPGGQPTTVVRGVWRQALSPPPAACLFGRAARVPRPVFFGRGWCGRGDSVPAPKRAPLRAVVARCGDGGKASPGGDALRHCEGRLSSAALPPPAARAQGGLSGSATDVLWAQVSGRGCPALSLWLACPACHGSSRGAVPGEGHLPSL